MKRLWGRAYEEKEETCKEIIKSVEDFLRGCLDFVGILLFGWSCDWAMWIGGVGDKDGE